MRRKADMHPTASQSERQRPTGRWLIYWNEDYWAELFDMMVDAETAWDEAMRAR